MYPVRSCFSALAIYSSAALLTSGCDYAYADEDTCEHVPFHRCLAERGHARFAVYPPLAVRVRQHKHRQWAQEAADGALLAAHDRRTRTPWLEQDVCVPTGLQ